MPVMHSNGLTQPTVHLFSAHAAGKEIPCFLHGRLLGFLLVHLCRSRVAETNDGRLARDHFDRSVLRDAVVKPVARGGGAVRSGTMQVDKPVPSLPRLDHAAGDPPFAEDADSLVIQGIPFPVHVRFLQRGELAVEGKTLIHAERVNKARAQRYEEPGTSRSR